MSVFNKPDPTGRVPPGQHLTRKFPVLTAGTPKITPAKDWDFALVEEAEDLSQREVARWSYAAMRASPQQEFLCDIHCVTRWSKLDTRWRGLSVDAILAAAGYDPGARKYLRVEADGDYAANLKLEDLRGQSGFLAFEYDAGDGFAPLPQEHGGPARLVAPKLYFWKSAKWARRIVISPYDRKGFWEKLGYHNYGDPWKEQRYRGLSDDDYRKVLDMDLQRKVREARLKSREGS